MVELFGIEEVSNWTTDALFDGEALYLAVA